MPDTFATLYRTPDERAVERSKNAFWDAWEDEGEMLGTIQVDALGLLSSLDALRSDTMAAKQIEEIDFFAADFAGSLYDLISNRIGNAKKTGDDKGIGPDWIDCETGVFTEEVDKWLLRAKSRRAERVEMTADDLGLSGLRALAESVK